MALTTVVGFEPQQIVAGDTVKWSRYIEHYPADKGWVLTYRFTGSTGSFVVVSASDPANPACHLVSLSMADTSTYVVGDYKWLGLVANATDRYTILTGRLSVFSDLYQATGIDARSNIKRTLDAIEAKLESRATKDQESYTINGVSISRMSLTDLLALYKLYQRRYARELELEQRENGTYQKTTRVKLARF